MQMIVKLAICNNWLSVIFGKINGTENITPESSLDISKPLSFFKVLMTVIF